MNVPGRAVIRRSERVSAAPRGVRPWAWLVGGLLCLSGIPVTANECRVEHDRIVIELPEGQDSVEQVVPLTLGPPGTADLPNAPAGDGPCDVNSSFFDSNPVEWIQTNMEQTWWDQVPISFIARGVGLFEATAVLTATGRVEYCLGGVESEAGRFRDVSVTFDGRAADSATDVSRTYGDRISAGVHRVEMEFGGRKWFIPYSRDPCFYGTETELRLKIRRVPARCMMHAIVTGGPGAGEYRGDVAFFGNPTGMGDDAGKQVEAMVAWAQNMAKSIGVEQEGTGVSGTGGGTKKQPAKSFDEALREELGDTRSLTLQDVKMDDKPGAGRSAAKLVTAFDLTAHVEPAVETGPAQPGEGPLLKYGVSVLGLKTPGFMGNIRRCSAPAPILYFQACPGEDTMDMGQAPYCGHIDAEVCNGWGERTGVRVKAEFIAGDSLTDCIH